MFLHCLQSNSHFKERSRKNQHLSMSLIDKDVFVVILNEISFIKQVNKQNLIYVLLHDLLVLQSKFSYFK